MSDLSRELADLKFSSTRIFINDIDSYHSRNIVDSLLKNPNLRLKVICEGCPFGKKSSIIEEEVYQICGTVSDSNIKQIENVEIIEENNLFEVLLYCGIVVIDITRNTKWLEIVDTYLKIIDEIVQLPNTCLCQERYFILISSFLTWALTKPLDPDLPTLPFIETDYRKRSPHPNYKKHFKIENKVLAMGKKCAEYFRTVVLMAGMTYGCEEETLFFWFQQACQCVMALPVIGTGNNILPMIHVKDLGTIIMNLIINQPNQPYIFAIEPTFTTQIQIIKPLAEVCGAYKFKKIPKEDSFLLSDIDQTVFDNITANKVMEPVYVLNFVQCSLYFYQGSFRDKVMDLMNEFKVLRNITPPRIIVYGLPGSGKTTISKRIADYYGCVYISPDTIQQDIIYNLADILKVYEDLAKTDIVEDDSDIFLNDFCDEDVDWVTLAENTRKSLETLTSRKPLDDDDVAGFVKERLMSNTCLNRGWVLDGYPKDRSQCEAIFGQEYDISVGTHSKGGGDARASIQCSGRISLPSSIIQLSGSETFIKQKIAAIPECALRDSSLEDSNFQKRLRVYKLNNTPEYNPAFYFLSMKVPLRKFNIEEDGFELNLIFKQIKVVLGSTSPCTVPGQVMENERSEILKEAEKDVEEQLQYEKEINEEFMKAEERRMTYYSELLALRDSKGDLLAAATEPFRYFLVKFIAPGLIDGIFECASNKPENPMIFLAKYLFEHNDDGKMCPPGFDLQREISAGRFNLGSVDVKEMNYDISIPALENTPSTSSDSILSLPAINFIHSKQTQSSGFLRKDPSGSIGKYEKYY